MFWKKTKSIVKVIEDKCRNCRYCVYVCRHRVLEIAAVQERMCTFVARPERCTGCGKCVKNCPEQAIEMIKK